MANNERENRQTGGIPGLSLDDWINQQDNLATLQSNSQVFGVMDPADLEFRQMKFEEILFALDPHRIVNFSLANGISPEQARTELIRTAAAALDNGWASVLNENNGNTPRAKDFLRQELINAGETGLFQVTALEFNNERDGLKELYQNPEALQFIVDNLALVNPYTYGRDPNNMGLILAAKGQGSAQGLSNVIEGAIKGPSMLAMQVMYAINYPDDAWNSTVDYAQKALEDFSYYGPENTLHIMQGHV